MAALDIYIKHLVESEKVISCSEMTRKYKEAVKNDAKMG